MKAEATVTDVLRNFSDYINRVAYRGERFTLIRGGKPVAELAPALPAGGGRLGDLPALLRSIPRLADEEAHAFAQDVAEGRAEIDATPPLDPWES